MDAKDSGDSGERSKDGLGIADAIKKVVSAGLSAAFITEDSLRQYVAELKLPKEVLTLLLQQAQKSKDELVLRAAKEISGLLQKVNWTEELSKFAENHKFTITVEMQRRKDSGEKTGVGDKNPG